ncbi:gluconate 2-dehydrogenase subunit 3 family protein [Pseudarthrobacter sp. AL07]|uniref:gluconate 2-dehydrogenase subunit 3 family protein n=2 Tax=unclassified Pseudarthrobacter TaxID=2647000 RepID=UPI00249CB4F2|nr:gluconate 2-dehydrogenase subunit 3 family protein [Pseudarthrobacter sp. AL07]MDI3209630.1 gluconate 2-dehydrogenase subunit 3 family protein [Pseudarthrobacter sp. AL07]
MNQKQTTSPPVESMALTYFTDFQAKTVEAVAERIIPANGDDAGATEAGVVYYIDRSVTGFSVNLQRIYRLGLRELERYCSDLFHAQFHELETDQQDEIVRDLLGPEVIETSASPASGQLPEPLDQDIVDDGHRRLADSSVRVDREILRRLFAVIREHTVEGYFCDPVYGGNRDTVGWKLVGFPGAQWGYTAEQMKPGFDASTIVIKTLSDLRRDLSKMTDNKQYYSNEVK